MTPTSWRDEPILSPTFQLHLKVVAQWEDLVWVMEQILRQPLPDTDDARKELAHLRQLGEETLETLATLQVLRIRGPQGGP